MPLTIAILAGGRSSRMGADKALLSLAGVPLLERVARTASHLSSDILILGREAAPSRWPADLPARFIADAPLPPGQVPAGPMPALLAQLERLQTQILLLACDTPLLTPATLRDLVTAHSSVSPAPRATVTMTQSSEGTFAQPALALYTPAVIPLLRCLLAHARGSFQPLLREPGIHAWPLPSNRAHELLNLNTPDALARAESLLRTCHT